MLELRDALNLVVSNEPQIGHGGTVRIYGYYGGGRDHPFTVAKPLEFQTIDEPMAYYDPIVSISTSAAQRLADSLWDAGIRPTQSGDRVDEVGALRRHLEDMRAIAFGSIAKTFSQIRKPGGRDAD